MRKLTPSEEFDFLREIRATTDAEKTLSELRDAFNVLQVRSQMLLGLITICLTITGFSGPRIASSGTPARIAIFIGVLCVLASALVLVVGPLHIRWITHFRGDSVEHTLLKLIRRRNTRTLMYHVAAFCLVVGLGGYVLSLGFFLMSH
jgi:hypothetical protein